MVVLVVLRFRWVCGWCSRFPECCVGVVDCFPVDLGGLFVVVLLIDGGFVVISLYGE